MCKKKDFDTLSFIMDYEAGVLETDSIIEGFQHLIDTGMAWTLQGSYGRTAARLIEENLCTPPPLRKETRR